MNLAPFVGADRYAHLERALILESGEIDKVRGDARTKGWRPGPEKTENIAPDETVLNRFVGALTFLYQRGEVNESEWRTKVYKITMYLAWLHDLQGHCLHRQ